MIGTLSMRKLVITTGLVFASTTVIAEKLDSIAAVVNNDLILLSEVENETSQQIRQIAAQNQRAPARSVVQPQVLDKLIDDKLKIQRAERAGITVTERELNEAVSQIAKRNGLTLAQFAERIRADGLNYLGIRDSLRTEIMINKIRQKEIEARIGVSSREVDDALKSFSTQLKTNATFSLQHILIEATEELSAEEQTMKRKQAESLVKQLDEGADFYTLAVAYSDGQKALDGGELGDMTLADMPALFTEYAQGLNAGEHSDVISSPNGYHIIRVANITGADLGKRIEINTRHILVGRLAQQQGVDPRKLAADIKRQLDSGADFNSLAAQYSEDPGSRNTGGDLGWRDPNVFIAEFRKAALGLKKGEISQPVMTQFGLHIIQLVDTREFDEPLETRKLKMRQAIYQRKLLEEVDLWQTRIRDEAYIEKRI